MEEISNIAMVFVFVGVFLIARLNVAGQLLMAIAQVLWFVVGFTQDLMALYLQSAGLFFLAIYAIWNWRKKMPKKSVNIERGSRVLL